MIDEKELIDKLQEWADEALPFESDIVTDVIGLIEEQPKVGEWIPVSEQLPHKNDNYLVTVRSYDETASIDFICVDHCNADGTWLHYNKPGKQRGKCVIAWMPLPEPYEGDETKEVEHD